MKSNARELARIVDANDLSTSGSENIVTSGELSSGLLSYAGDGSNLTSLNASNILTGTLSPERFPETIVSDISGNAATATNASQLNGLTSDKFLRSDVENSEVLFSSLKFNNQFSINLNNTPKFTINNSGVNIPVTLNLNSDLVLNSGRIQGLSTVLDPTDAASKGYVDSTVQGAVVAGSQTAQRWETPRTISLAGDLSGSVTIDGSSDETLTVNIQPNSVNLGTDTVGDYVSSVTSGSGIVVTNPTGEGSVATIEHANTSDVVDFAGSNANGVVHQNITLNFDEFGHVTAVGGDVINLDDRFHTKSISDSRYVNVEGDTITGDLTISGDLTVNGTTTSVNSTVTTLDDPILTLADNSTTTNDSKDRGIEFKYGNGSTIKTGFFGWDNTDGRFKFIQDGTNSSETITGTLGIIQANSFIGDGSTLTNLSASNISSGTISDARLPETISSDITGNAATASDSDKLDGLNASDFLRSNTTNTVGTFTDIDIAGSIRHVGDSDTGIDFFNDIIDLSTNGIVRLTVASNGNVGIGGGSPAEKLDVLGNVKAASFIGDGSQLTGIDSGSGLQGSNGDEIFAEYDKIITSDYAITQNKNALTAGPVKLAENVTVTIPDGSSWKVL